MKMRNGFVSNSSSSSFIVGFPRKPQTKEDIKQMVFNGEDSFVYDMSYPNPESFPVDRASEVLLNGFEYSRIKAISTLLSDYRGEVGYMIGEVAREIAQDGCNSFTFENGSVISTATRSRRIINEMLAKLKAFNPDVDWSEMAEKEINRIASALKEQKAISGKRRKLVESLRVKHKIPVFQYKDTNEMSRQAKAEYEKKQKAHDKKEEKYIEKNAEYLALEKEEGAINRIIYPWYEPKGSVSHEFSKGLTRIFLKENEENVLAFISISDNDGSLMGAMEHGNIFRRLKHEQFSHH